MFKGFVNRLITKRTRFPLPQTAIRNESRFKRQFVFDGICFNLAALKRLRVLDLLYDKSTCVYSDKCNRNETVIFED